MDFEFDGPVWWWRGPSPWHYVSIPPDYSAEIKELAAQFTFGWGMIPGVVTIGGTRWYTAFFEKDGLYVIPLKAAVRRREGIELEDVVHVRVELGGNPAADPGLRIE